MRMTDRGGEAERRYAPEVIVALDYPDPDAAFRLVEMLPEETWYKVGLELFTLGGPTVVRRLVDAGHHVFLDLKLHDIPSTVAGAVRAASEMGVRLLTLHASGGEAMLRAAAEAVVDAETGRTRLLAITVLTSLDDEALDTVMGRGSRVEETVGRLAGLARECGADGVVSSVSECRAVKVACGPDFLVVTPGIRLAGQETHDQKRVASPAVARAAGADFLVIGRSVTRADDPRAALLHVRREIEHDTP